MIDIDYNNQIPHYYEILDLRKYHQHQHSLRVETLEKSRNRPNPQSILMTYSEYIEFKKTNKYLIDIYA